jgi:predicted TIM-barrel fold metal-dependent hydrolase
MSVVIDSDQHLSETRSLWRDHIDPSLRDDALAIEDDELGYSWVTWHGRRLQPVDVQRPGETSAIGDWHERIRRGEPPTEHYDDVLPRDYWDPAARADKLTSMGVDEAVVFPNFGLLWERTLDSSLPALTGNMRAWNRWCEQVVVDGKDRVHPVAHLTLRDPQWLLDELATLERAGVRLAMIAPALVDGVPLSHPSLDRAWSLFVEHGVTPVFHVADQPRPFHDAWYTDGELGGVPVLDSIFLWTPAALAATDLIVNGVFARHPQLRLGIVELSAVWVPMYLMMLDGGMRFVNRLYGDSRTALDGPGSDVFKRHVRVSSFAYELPERIIRQTGGSDLYMCCSDYPHSEGTATPVADYRGTLDAHPGLRSANAAFLLGR